MTERVKLPQRIVRQITVDAVDHAHEWFYTHVDDTDADELYVEIADRQGLDLEIESALQTISVVKP